jgi:hypothetical protein
MTIAMLQPVKTKGSVNGLYQTQLTKRDEALRHALEISTQSDPLLHLLPTSARWISEPTEVFPKGYKFGLSSTSTLTPEDYLPRKFWFHTRPHREKKRQTRLHFTQCLSD